MLSRRGIHTLTWLETISEIAVYPKRLVQLQHASVLGLYHLQSGRKMSNTVKQKEEEIDIACLGYFDRQHQSTRTETC